MSITWDDVELVDASLSTVPEAVQDAILADVALQLESTSWGTKLDLASKYLAAHHGALYLRGSSGAGGPLASESIGDASRSYAVFSPTGSDSTYDTTPWGKEFRRLMRQLPARLGVLV